MAIEFKYLPKDRWMEAKWTIEDPEIDSVYKRLEEIEIDVNNKIKELKELQGQYEQLTDEAYKKWDELDNGVSPDKDEEPELYAKWIKDYDKALEEYEEYRGQKEAIEQALEDLENITNKF